MKNLFTLFFSVITFAVNAQFSLQPQIGLENSRTTIKSNDFQCFSPLGLQFAPSVALRMNYKFKTGHGAFVGLATSSPAVDFKFTDPQTARTSYTATAKELQLRFEGGYQFTSKPISLGNTGSSNGYRSKCGERKEVSRSSCVRRGSASHGSRSYNKSAAANKGWYMRIVPSAGLAFIPSAGNEIETETKAGQTTYEYNAGWKTALIAGTAFEFGTKRQSKFIVSVNYLKSLGNAEQTLNTMANGKPVTTSLRSKASSFTVRLGIPFSLAKNKTVSRPKQCERSNSQRRCGQYRFFQQ